MSLRQKSWAAAGVILVGIVVAIVGSISGGAAKGAGFLLILAGLALDIVWLRCPRCGAWLGKYPGGHCESCGERINWNGK